MFQHTFACFCLLLGSFATVSAASYTVAYVEHMAKSACGSGSCGEQTKALNVASYATYASKAAQSGADIIVFPEYGITGQTPPGLSLKP